MSKNCGIIKDLLPLYADDVCTEESRKLVAEHIAGCSECRAELEKMGKKINVSTDADVKVMKRIKKRLRIEKITVGIISLVTVLAVGVFTAFMLINTLCPMDVRQIGIGDELRAEVDEDGELWLVMKNYAATEDYIMPTISDENGKHLGETGFDADAKAGFGVTFMHRRIDALACFNSYDSAERRVGIVNVDEENIDRFFYYDEKNKVEYTLWERVNNE